MLIMITGTVITLLRRWNDYYYDYFIANQQNIFLNPPLVIHAQLTVMLMIIIVILGNASI